MNRSPERRLYLDYLRSALILLIVLEHVSIAYTSAAKLNFFSCKDSIWFIADPNATEDLLLYIRAFRFPFAIPLLFFISGLFLDVGIRRYGIALYSLRRLMRVGVPLLVIAFILSPLTHYLPCILTWRKVELSNFFFNEFFSGQWYIIHGWFLWMLLVFEAIAVTFRALFGETYARIGRAAQRMVVKKPSMIYALLFLCSYLGFAAGAALVNPKFSVLWEVLSGPFFFVDIRYLVDFSFFLFGVMLGQAYGHEQFRKIEEAIFASPFMWIAISCLILLIAWIMPMTNTRSFFTLWHDPALRLHPITTPALSVSLSLALISVFRRYVNFQSAFLQSLSRASYTIYIFHFIICVWTEYILLSSDVSVYLKVAVSYLTAVLASWGLYIIKEGIASRAKLSVTNLRR